MNNKIIDKYKHFKSEVLIFFNNFALIFNNFDFGVDIVFN